jgi:hypothetical protein
MSASRKNVVSTIKKSLLCCPSSLIREDKFPDPDSKEIAAKAQFSGLFEAWIDY